METNDQLWRRYIEAADDPDFYEEAPEPPEPSPINGDDSSE